MCSRNTFHAQNDTMAENAPKNDDREMCQVLARTRKTGHFFRFVFAWRFSRSRKSAKSLGNGAPAATRTRDPRLRRPVLYPTELRAHVVGSVSVASLSGLRAARHCEGARAVSRRANRGRVGAWRRHGQASAASGGARIRLGCRCEVGRSSSDNGAAGASDSLDAPAVFHVAAR